MLVRVGNSKDVVAGKMRAFEVEGTPVNVANVDGRLWGQHADIGPLPQHGNPLAL